MAIQLPQLKRIGPADPVPEGQLNVEAPNYARAFTGVAQSLQGVGKEVVDWQEKLEDDAANVAAVKADTEFRKRIRTDMKKAQAWDGDPTEVYSQLDEKWVQHENDVLKQYEGASERTKNAIRTKLAQSNHLLADDRAVNQEVQFQAYAMKVDNDAVSLRREELLGAIETVDANDDDSFNKLRIHVGEIRDIRYNSGKRTGLVFESADGKVSISPSLKMQMKKDLSDSLSDVVTTLNAAGKTAEAQKILDEFKNDFLSDHRSKLLAGTEKSTIKREALSAADQVKHLPPDEALKALNKVKNLEVREQAEQFLHAHQIRLKNAEDRAANTTFETLADYVRERQASDKPFVSIADMRNDQTFARLSGGVKDKHIRSLENTIEAPKHSDDEVKGALFEKMFRGELTGMTYAQLNAEMAALNAKDRNVFEKFWTQENSQTSAEKNAALRYMGPRVREQMVAQGLIKQKMGKISEKSKTKVTAFYDELVERSQTLPPGTTIDQWNRYVKDFVAEKAREQAFEKEAPPKLDGGLSPRGTPAPRGTPVPTGTPAPAASRTFTAAEGRELIKEFRTANPGQIFSADNPAHVKWAQDWRNKRSNK